MEKVKNVKNTKTFTIICIIIICICVGVVMSKNLKKEKEEPKKEVEIIEPSESFNMNIIKKTNEESNGENYLISPYNIEIALNMLREGALGNTKDEIDKVIGNRKINDVSIKDKLNIANGVFIKNQYKNDVKEDFTNILKNNYHAELLYDDYETPTVINNWVKEKTNNMIDNLLDSIPERFVLGLASALALDIKWDSEFECINTVEEEFIKADNSKMKVEMMHQTYKYNNASYFTLSDAKGIILPYKKELDNNNELEFVGILPNQNVQEYVNSLTEEKINDIYNNTKVASDKLHINLSLPRFTYSYDVKDLSNVLKNMGIKSAFDPNAANFKRMISKDVYVSTAIHKTKIELNEVGTKAAAVTYFGMEANGLAPQDFEEINITFNKPFVYMIREKNTGEILFFGTVYEPNKWEGSTCKN